MRLIDADALIKKLNEFCGNQRYLIPEQVWKIAEELPTAYDTEKVKKDIDRVGKSFCDYVACNEECTSCEHHSIMDAVTSIVRKGGVE